MGAGFSLDPAQQHVVSLPPDTPAILLTAGAGTGKTHTLAARLARLLGVEPRTATELRVEGEISGPATAGAAPMELDRPCVSAGQGQGSRSNEGDLGNSRIDADAASPESILVLSFTNQVCAAVCASIYYFRLESIVGKLS